MYRYVYRVNVYWPAVERYDLLHLMTMQLNCLATYIIIQNTNKEVRLACTDCGKQLRITKRNTLTIDHSTRTHKSVQIPFKQALSRITTLEEHNSR